MVGVKINPISGLPSEFPVMFSTAFQFLMVGELNEITNKILHLDIYPGPPAICTRTC